MTNLQIFSDNILGMGRHVNHDPRSKDYAFDASAVTPKSVRHTRKIPVLDQGQLGSCTGNAMTGALGTATLFDALPPNTLSVTDSVFNENFAVSLYSLATSLDGYKGQYPPTDTGSDGLSVAKAAQKKGLISGYQHTFNFAAFLSALTLQQVIAGISWYSSFETPDANGLIKIEKTAYVEGGHEICIDELDMEGQRIGFTNSWSVGWGLNGRAYIGFNDFEALLANKGDVTVPLALSLPAPVPTPPGPVNPTPAPTPSPDDVALWADMQKWAKAKGLA